jgi:hypothetical protein
MDYNSHDAHQEANKEKGQYMFSDQFGFIFLNM